MNPTFYTLTGNLLWERTLEFTVWSVGKTQRARADTFQVGGKGINVSRMLTRLGAPNIALCFAGGSTGADCVAWLQSKGIALHVFPIERPTRIGTVIRAEKIPETTFFSPDVPPDAAAWKTCADYVENIPTGNVLALCGSFPGWNEAEAEPLRIALAGWAKRGGILVADTYGPPLNWAVQQPLALVKINRNEFEQVGVIDAQGKPLEEQIFAACQNLPPQAWVVSDGEKPVWFAERGTRPDFLVPASVEMISSTGCGDVLLACLLRARYAQRRTLRDALTYALPYAAANAAHPGIAEFDLTNLTRS